MKKIRYTLITNTSLNTIANTNHWGTIAYYKVQEQLKRLTDQKDYFNFWLSQFQLVADL